jgi:hypothetical protein
VLKQNASPLRKSATWPSRHVELIQRIWSCLLVFVIFLTH